ncbi:MAG: DUF998 domain-containing protein [Anaerolineae bacterium]
MVRKMLFVCGMLFPVVYITMTILGGALRPGYSHIANTVSELLSPGAPNKRLLAGFQIAHALTGVLFGIGVLQFVIGSDHNVLIGRIGAGMITAAGLATVGTAIFPQDATGAPPTIAGTLHGILVFGVLVPCTILSTLLVGIWLKQAGILAWFRTYSYVTVGATLVLTAFAGAMLESQIVGLAERLGILPGFIWTFVLALRLLQL